MPSRRVMAARAAALAGAGGWLFGFDLGVVGGALEGMDDELKLGTVGKEAVVASAKLGAAFGCVLGGALLLSVGRRLPIALAAVPYTVGPLVMLVAPNAAVMVLGRFVVGLGVGVASVAAPCYLSETATPETRGALVACYEVAIAGGMLFASLTDYAFSHVSHGWRYMVAAGLPPALVLPLALVALPESQRWLISRGEMRRALRAIEWLRGSEPPPESERTPRRLPTAITPAVDGVDVSHCPWVNDELMDVWTSVELFERSQDFVAHGGKPMPSTSSDARPVVRHLPSGGVDWYSTFGALVHNARSIWTLIRSPPGACRRGLWIACALAFFNQMVASTSVIVYSQELARLVGVSSPSARNAIAASVAASKLVGVVAGLWAIDRIGRRPLLLGGSFISTAALVGLALGAMLESPLAVALCACAFAASFYASWGVAFWVLATELFTTAHRGAGQGLATALLYVFGSLASMVFLSLAKSPAGLLPFAFVSLLGGLFVFAYVPETRGLSLEEVMSRLAYASRGLPAVELTTNALADDALALSSDPRGDGVGLVPSAVPRSGAASPPGV